MGLFRPGLMCWNSIHAFVCRVHMKLLISAACVLSPVLKEGSFLVQTHHVEYCDGGILDPDDILSDLVEDKDKVRSFSISVLGELTEGI